MSTPLSARVHYETSFRIRTHDVNEVFLKIIRAIRTWIARKERQDQGLLGSWFFSGGGWTNHNDRYTRVMTLSESVGKSLSLWSLFYQEGDSEMPGRRFWYTDIGVRKISENDLIFSVRISYALNREFIGDEPPRPQSTVPKLVRNVFEMEGIQILSGDLALHSHPTFLHMGQGDKIENAIFRTRRFCPIVFVNGSFHAERFPIDPVKLQQKILGKAKVFYADDDAEFGEELSFCLPSAYRCSFRSVRIYLPWANPERSSDSSRHRYFTSREIADQGYDVFFESIATSLLGRFTNRDPEGILTHSDIIDLQRAATLDRLKRDGGMSREYIELLEEESGRLHNDLSDHKDLLLEADEEIDKLNARCQKLQAHNSSLLAIRNQIGDGNDVRRKSYLKIQDESSTLVPADCLRALEFLYHDRVRILPSAFISAEESEAFKFSQNLWELLLKLGDDYYSTLASNGGGDAKAKEVFGSSFAATESETTMSSRRCILARTFIDGDCRRLMFHHLKIGVKDSISETIRVHFDWDPVERVIVIGHCGPHLPI